MIIYGSVFEDYELSSSADGQLIHKSETRTPVSISTPTINQGCQKSTSSSDTPAEITATVRQISVNPGTPKTPNLTRTKPCMASATRMMPIHLVLDKASCYKSAAFLATLRLIEYRVTVNWLPAYCSELNPIDRFWRYLKEQVCVNKIKPDMDDLVQAVIDQPERQNNCQQLDRFSLFRFIV